MSTPLLAAKLAELRQSRGISQKELADYLGTTRPSLSRELMKMQQEQLIETDRNTIKIVDRDALEALY